MKHEDKGDTETTRSGLFYEAVRIIKEMRNADKLRHQRLSNTENWGGGEPVLESREGVICGDNQLRNLDASSTTNRNGGSTNFESRITQHGLCSSDRRTDDIRPRYAVYENVPGAFSSNQGEDFRAVLEEIARVADETVLIPQPPKGKWTNAGSIVGNGYSIAWRVLDAQYWGVPQRRRRIALVADFGGQSASEILFERIGLSGDIEESGEAGQGITESAENRIRTAGGKDVTSTLFSAYGTKWNGNSVALTGDHFVAMPVAEGVERGVEKAVCYGVISKGNGDAFITPERHTTSDGGQAGQGYPAVLEKGFEEVECIAFQGKAGAEASLQIGCDVCSTLSCTKEVMICTTNQTIAYGLDSYNQTMSSEVMNPLRSANGGDTKPMCMLTNSYIVRRLTPLECERLQGYPDGWTNIPNIEPHSALVDFFTQVFGEHSRITGAAKKTHKAVLKWMKSPTSDSTRYKALGNSIALPPWRWICQRIHNTYNRPITLGSLFDGIGGFPKIWEEINGKGSTIWASEIEPFPIAVTKYHFE